MQGQYHGNISYKRWKAEYYKQVKIQVNVYAEQERYPRYNDYELSE